jgi:glycerol-3-phosphate dehydrogenase
MFEHDRAYILPSPDGRVVFARPFGPDFTLIGTTDEDFVGDPASAAVEPREVEYLCDVVNGFFRAAIAPPDAVWAFAGVRALYDDGASNASETTREYLLALDRADGRAPLLTVYGGKITTYRHLAEGAMAKLGEVFTDARARAPWTAKQPLPGGDFAPGGDDAVVAQTCRAWPFLTQAHARRLVAAYGTRVRLVLEGVARAEDMGPRFGADLTGVELRYLMRHEWAQSADDVLWRRSKLGLHLSKEEAAAVERFMTGAVGA